MTTNARADPYKCFKYLSQTVTDEIVVSGVGFHEWLGLTAGREGNCPVGGMGTTVALALGIAQSLPKRKVICLTTDGDLLFDLSILPSLGAVRPNNLVVIVNDNECYQTTHADRHGYWPSLTKTNTDLAAVARACGIDKAVAVYSEAQFASKVSLALRKEELGLIVVKTAPRLFMGFRPDTEYTEHKFNFAHYVERIEGIQILPLQKQDRTLIASDESRPRSTHHRSSPK